MSPPDADVSLNIWDYKPWWCQPWSILLTGILLIAGSWFLFHRLWITGLVAFPVLVWMGFFLWIYPQAMRAELSQTHSTAAKP
jgi:hypothetical protein